MKNIADIYNENAEIVATPANTMGMGNPMPATETTHGTEPLVRKRKNKKCKPCEEPAVKEGLLSGQDATLQVGDDELEFVKWFVGQHVEEYKTIDKDAAMNATFSAVSFKGKDTVVIDVKQAYEGEIINKYSPDVLIIKSKLWPKHIKKLIVTNSKYSFAIHSYISDLSKLDIEVYRDDQRTYGNLDAAFKMATSLVISNAIASR